MDLSYSHDMSGSDYVFPSHLLLKKQRGENSLVLSNGLGEWWLCSEDLKILFKSLWEICRPLCRELIMLLYGLLLSIIIKRSRTLGMLYLFSLFYFYLPHRLPLTARRWRVGCMRSRTHLKFSVFKIDLSS